MANQNIRSSDPRNYQIPARASVWFRKKGDSAPADWVDLGHLLEVNVTPELETVEHRSHRRGERTVDRELVVGRSMRISMRLDEVQKQNLMYALGSSGPAAADAAIAHEDKVFNNPGNAFTIDLGATNLNAVVVRSEGLEGVITTYASPADYTVVLGTGIITIAAGALANPVTVPRIHVYWDKSLVTESFETHDATEIEGELKLQVLKGGIRYQLHAKKVVLKPSGDFPINDGSTWQEFSLEAKVLSDDDGKMPKLHVVNENQTF